MTEPSRFDDDWAELARELERDKPASPPPASDIEPPAEPAHVDDGLMEGEELDEFDDAGIAGEAEPNGDAAPGEGPPGTGRKRRRRRRRRRKGAGSTAEATDEADGDKGEHGEGEGEESEVEAVEAEYGDEQVEEEMEEIEVVSAEESEEDTGGELLRELIANWNVPSWDEVVSGLYRP